jgi:hypothetical protein
MADDRKPKEQQGLPEGWKWVRLGDKDYGDCSFYSIQASVQNLL